MGQENTIKWTLWLFEEHAALENAFNTEDYGQEGASQPHSLIDVSAVCVTSKVQSLKWT